MKKTGIREEQLKCGVHDPLNKEAAREVYTSGSVPSSIHCNCSGKHLGLMSAICAKGLPLEGYYIPDHPVYEDLERVISDFTGVPRPSIVKSTDGCGIPVYGVPLKNMALAYANMGNKRFLDGKYEKQQNILIRAMTAYPEMIGGEKRLDTALIQNFGDRLICKIGDEGAHCVSLLGRGIGISLKIEDGSLRAVDPAAVEILRQLKIISEDEVEKIRDFWNPAVLNHRKEKVGEIRTVFELGSIPIEIGRIISG